MQIFAFRTARLLKELPNPTNFLAIVLSVFPFALGNFFFKAMEIDNLASWSCPCLWYDLFMRVGFAIFYGSMDGVVCFSRADHKIFGIINFPLDNCRFYFAGFSIALQCSFTDMKMFAHAEIVIEQGIKMVLRFLVDLEILYGLCHTRAN